ncbi:MAG: LD-carboxypeptidase [Myxococcota bacterium]|nr:LD-carboxypeptidase [Deltaproteobacteria bacterium]MCP4240945.1 LD-carboxypeptidase [bacterium]MDP6075568.1 LD-carboxypeptidase [Myxococcota bacterium]MDP6244294.1 LD-carboxypeptidase [Myxococcota bacterium]MDP7076291.1 LD-carboxypeptidase [Myxococcota bacterium]
MYALRKPRALAAGAMLGIAAPGGPVDPDRVDAGCALLEAAGFGTFRRDDLTDRRGYLAGDDDRRVAELTQLWEDPAVGAIVCARGGYGCDRILDRLDPALVREAAKPLVGYSDVTALLLWQAKHAGLAGFHGPMLDRGSDADPAAVASLAGWLMGKAEARAVFVGTGQSPGVAEGPLIGGSLTLLAASAGTSWEVEPDGAILLLEETNESPYRVDRMLQQLRSSGRLEGVVGLGCGDLTSCIDPRYDTQVGEVIAEFSSALGVPCVTELPFGHGRTNFPWPFGGRATIDGSSGEVRMLDRGVEVAV